MKKIDFLMKLEHLKMVKKLANGSLDIMIREYWKEKIHMLMERSKMDFAKTITGMADYGIA